MAFVLARQYLSLSQFIDRFMKYYIRLLLLLMISPFRKPVQPLGPCVTKFRVWPNDLDVFMHMNNGAYLTIMDLARTDMMIRAGIVKGMVNRRWYPVVVAETIRFKHSLKLFQQYEIETEVVCWDHRAFYLVQTFTRNDEFVAKAAVEARFLSTSGKRIPVSDLLVMMGHTSPSPPMPAWISDWQHAQPGMSEPQFIEE